MKRWKRDDKSGLLLPRSRCNFFTCGPAFFEETTGGGGGGTPFLTALLATSPVVVYGMGDIPAGSSQIVTDLSGNGNNGTSGAFSSGSLGLASLLPGGEGSSCAFWLGESCSVAFPNVSAIVNANRNCTVSGWFKLNQNTSDGGIMIQCGTTGLSFYLNGSGGPGSLVMGKSNISNDATFASTMTNGSIYWLALTISSSGVYKMYVNGIADSVTGTTTSTYSGSSGPGHIGNNAATGNNRYGNSTARNALMQYIAVHNVALTSTQISTLWAAA